MTLPLRKDPQQLEPEIVLRLPQNRYFFLNSLLPDEHFIEEEHVLFKVLFGVGLEGDELLVVVSAVAVVGPFVRVDAG